MAAVAQVEFEHAGARVVIPSETITRLWIEKAMGPKPIIGPVGLPRIGAVINGETFMGIARGEDGIDQMVFDLGEAEERMNHAAAVKWASERGGTLPNRREGALLFANRDEGQFKQEWYWLAESRAGDESSAWVQYFLDGTQDDARKSYAYRVRAVRRQAIQ